MDRIRSVVRYLVANLGEGEVAYLKSKEIVGKVSMTKREVSTRLHSIGSAEEWPIEVSKWSKSNGSVTFRIVIEDVAAINERLYQSPEERAGGDGENVPRVV